MTITSRSKIRSRLIFALPFSYLFLTVSTLSATDVSSTSHVPARPSIITDALRARNPLYYFAVGSNLSRSKLENRAIDGTIIRVRGVEPAVVRGHRLSFDLKGFPPLEPGMGSLEPVEDDDDGRKDPSRWSADECHGALYLLDPDDFERVMESEGIVTSRHNATANNRRGGNNNNAYEEIVVEAGPYDGRPPVRAVSLRARGHAVSRRPLRPSARYMALLREGARELGLRDDYAAWLNEHPVQLVPRWLQRTAVRNLVFSFWIGRRASWLRPLSRAQRWLVFCAYVPSVGRSTNSAWSSLRQCASNLTMGMVMLPGACVGTFLLEHYKSSDTMSPFLRNFVSRYE